MIALTSILTTSTILINKELRIYFVTLKTSFTIYVTKIY